jgi:hypothetical protein
MSDIVPFNPEAVPAEWQARVELPVEYEAVQDVVVSLRAAICVFEDLGEQYPNDPYGLSHLRRILSLFKRDMATVDRRLEDLQWKAMPAKKLEVPGVGQVERFSGKEWKQWDADALVGEIVESVSKGDGTAAVIAMDAITKLMELGRVEWRVTAIKAMGLEPTNFAEQTEKRPTVRMPSTVTE